jgi:hypothetical protein
MREGAFEVAVLICPVKKTRRINATHIPYGEESRDQEKGLREHPQLPTVKDMDRHYRSSDGTE